MAIVTLYLMMICDNIEPSKASKLEYEFVTKVTENEFYLHQAQG